MKNFDFMKNKKVFFIISSSLIVLTIILTIVLGVTLDIQFKGGAIIKYSYEGEMDALALDSFVENEIGELVTIQFNTDIANDAKTVTISLAAENGIDIDTQQALGVALSDEYTDNNLDILSISSVEPTMGREFLFKSLYAVAIASLLIVIFVGFRFRRIGGFSAGVMAIIALVHDLIMVFAFFVVFGIPLNNNFIAVMLAIIGYSVNDTIVIYNRIRENEKLYATELHLDEIVNKSINQSLVRSINTTVTTVMAMIVITAVAAYFGVTSIITFSGPMIIGLISGAYSSICIAGPLWITYKKRQAKKAK